MPSTFTIPQIVALAPDPASVKSGHELGAERNWATIGADEAAVWGECKGSGKLPYQTAVDLSEPAFKCSCPSRKFPCKHGLGLLLLFARDPAQFASNGPQPPWVSDWLVKRSTKTIGRDKGVAEENKPAPSGADLLVHVDDRRTQNVSEGVAELRTWLFDLVRQGFAEQQNKDASSWDRIAARMVDSQAPGAARLLREMSGLSSSGFGWQSRLLLRIGLLHLLLEAFERRNTLASETVWDIKTALGWTVKQEELLSQPGISDRWMVLGQRIVEEDRLNVRRTWIGGERSGKIALVLHFAHGSAAFEAPLTTGLSFDAEVIYFPGACPLRALIKDQKRSSLEMPWANGGSIAGQLLQYAKATSRNPWIERFPLYLASALPRRNTAGWTIAEKDGDALPVAEHFDRGWNLVALSGGIPTQIFGEWDGEKFWPLSIVSRRETAATLNELDAAQKMLATTSVMGTGRAPALKLHLMGTLGECISRINEDDPAKRLLDAAAMTLLYKRAAFRPDVEDACNEPPADAELQQACTARYAQLLTMMFRGSAKVVLPEALTLLKSNNLRVPFALLPDVLDLGAAQKDLQDLILPVVGRRGVWLAAMNPDWSYTAGQPKDDGDEDPAAFAPWALLDKNSRIALLRSLRKSSPDTARDLVISVWNEETAGSRAALIKELSIGLNLADEPFLEEALDDKSADVRKWAALLLSRLPGSRLSNNARTYAESLLSLKKRLLGSFDIDVRLPEQFIPAWKRDGIEELSWIKNVGDRAWWFVQWVGLVPPELWSTTFRSSPDAMLRLAKDSEWADPLVIAWTKGASLSSDVEWKYAVLKHWALERDNRTSITGLLPDINSLGALAPELLIGLLEYAVEPLHDQHVSIGLLQLYTSPWSDELARRVVRSLQQRVELLGDPKTLVWQTMFVLKNAALHINPELNDELESEWPVESPTWPQWRSSVQAFHGLLSFRNELHKELTA